MAQMKCECIRIKITRMNPNKQSTKSTIGINSEHSDKFGVINSGELG